MGQTWLISGPPGCGKTTWILNMMNNYQGACGYLRLTGYSDNNLEQVPNSEIDLTFLKDQSPEMRALSGKQTSIAEQEDILILIELPQFHTPKEVGMSSIDPRAKNQLETLQLRPDRYLHFGRDPELPNKDTLELTKLESWSLGLQNSVWDPASLNTFWFELVNGAYGDVYRAKALMNLPDGRSIFCNWIVTQEGSQFIPLKAIAPPDGRPENFSELVVQGKALDCKRIQSTIDLCLLSDAVLDMHQMSLRDRQQEATYSH
ncbi:ATP-binding protein [Prochlorococcus sp. MIT 1300]|uniref:ATP-binding protein n=1 Tax=Prochlorococcus sp. MIT 1300 TaxID=3096218 RepID=UPI002A756B76|nr:ATP-binding protein [Prochlorococcus sp. MIT 1300]